MNTIRQIAAAALVLVFASTATVSASRHCPAHTATDHSGRVHSIQKSLESEGYTLDGTRELPIYYFVPPKAPYIWGTMVYNYSRPVEGDVGQLETVQITVQVRALTEGFSFPEINVRENPSD